MKEFADRLTRRVHLTGALTVGDVHLAALASGVHVNARAAVPRGARCDRCHRRLTAEVFTIVGEAGDFQYGPKCYQIVKAEQ